MVTSCKICTQSIWKFYIQTLGVKGLSFLCSLSLICRKRVAVLMTLMTLMARMCLKNMSGLDKPEYERQLYWKEALEVLVMPVFPS